MRETSVLVFPVPGPAITATARSGAVTAAQLFLVQAVEGTGRSGAGVGYGWGGFRLCARAFGRFLAGPFFAGVCPRKKLICPFSCVDFVRIEAAGFFHIHRRSRAERSTCPGAQAADPLRNAGAGGAARCPPAAISRRMGNSGPELPQHRFVLCGDLTRQLAR